MKKSNVRNLTFIAVFAAIIAIISFLPIKTFGLEITLSMVPVAVGAICFGPLVGAILGGVFGVVSFLQCLGWSAFGVALLGINPILTAIVCIPTRIVAGWITGLIFKAFEKSGHANTGYVVSSFSAALLNTTLFMSALILSFYNTDFIQGIAQQLGAVNPVSFVLIFVGINGVVEIIAGFILAAPCAKALSSFVKKLNLNS